MDYFRYKGKHLYCEDVKVDDIVARVGSPAYIYSARTIREHYEKLDNAFSPIAHMLCYAVKANSNRAILRDMVRMGSGFDIVSGGELYRCMSVGARGTRIVFSGVGKSRDEIADAIRAGILMFNIESEEEVYRINNVAREMDYLAPLAIRVNPDVDAKTHKKITTGKKENKFGINRSKIKKIYTAINNCKSVELVGLQCHIGSQITALKPFTDAVKIMHDLVLEGRRLNHRIIFLDIGGGLGIIYNKEKPVTASEFGKAIIPLVKDLECTLIIEPGRLIVGNAGILATKVLYRKMSGAKNFVIVDAGMNDLIRPAMYDAYHEIWPVVKNANKTKKVDVVGPICESSDTFARDRRMPLPDAGAYLAIRGAGAYGFAMASNYNSRPLPAEILVKGSRWRIVRKRQTYKDLIHGESVFLKK